MFEQQFGVYPKKAYTQANGAVSGVDLRAAVCLTATTFDAISSATTTDASKMTGIELPAGTVIWDVQGFTINASSTGVVVGHAKSR